MVVSFSVRYHIVGIYFHGVKFSRMELQEIIRGSNFRGTWSLPIGDLCIFQVQSFYVRAVRICAICTPDKFSVLLCIIASNF